MILENKKDKVAPLPKFFSRIMKFTVLGFLLMVISLLLGTFGYHYFSAISWIDSFHMSCLILTGMGPVVEMKSVGAKLFSSFYALYSGIAFLTISAIFLSPIIHRILHILHLEGR